MSARAAAAAVATSPLAGMRKFIGKRLATLGHFEADLWLHRIPRCPQCEAANPQSLDFCPECGATAPDLTDRNYVQAVVPLAAQHVPWYAYVLLVIGQWLSRFGSRLGDNDQ